MRLTTMSSTIGALVLLVSLVALTADGLAVMSVDLGAEFMKIAIVKPGVPMEVVLNKESRRKTPLVVAIKGNDREFGESAMSRGIKTPKAAYYYLTQVLGKSIDNPAVKEYQERYPFYDIRQDSETGTIYFQHDEQTRYTPEELLGMLLDYARELAADFGEQAIDAAVIAVPPYFNQAERKAVLRAAEIANLKVLQIMNTNVAAGLNYGVFRRKDFNNTGTTLMFFDMGDAGVTATVASFHTVKNKDDYEPNPQLTVRGVGFDRKIGGYAFTNRLAKHLAKKFLEQSKKDVFKSPKAILKLYKEAERVKNILSANADTNAQVEGLMDDVDFKTKVTRDEFVNMCSDLFDGIDKVVQTAVKQAEISLDDIASVILVGGSTRIPRVQEELLKSTKKTELGKNLNTDEAPVLGAVYQAAFQSKGYKVKKFYIKDSNLYPLAVDFERYPSNDAEPQSSVIRRVLFDKLNNYPQRKVMTFSRHTVDFGFSINYGDLSDYSVDYLNLLGTQNISQVRLTGVKEVFEKHAGEESKGIKVHFRLDDSGILRVDKVDITFEKKQEVNEQESTLSKIGNSISSFFGSGSQEEGGVDGEKQQQGDEKSEEQQQTESTTAKPETTTPAAEQANNQTNTTAQDNLNQKNQTANITIIREDIKFEAVDLDFPAISSSRLEEYRTKLVTLREREKEKRKRAAAINSLETFIFDTKDKLNQDEFIKCSTESEREILRGKLDEADMWLSETDDSVETKQFSEKLSELKAAGKPIFFRLKEKKNRPIKLDELKDVLNKSVDFLANTKNITGEDQPLTEVEWNTLDKLINTTKEWRVKMLNEQAKVADHEDPKLLAADISEKIDELKREVNYMVSKIKYFKPKKKATTKKPTESEDKSNKTEEPESNGSEDQSDDYFNKGEESTGENESDDSTTTTSKPETTENPEL